MKDESEWIKIPDHHPAIVSKELFEQVRGQLVHFKSVKKNAEIYTLRGKVFCGCCRHAMQRPPAKNPQFICRYTSVDRNAPCHGMKISENELETMLFQIPSKQAQIILNLDNLSRAGTLDIQLAKQSEYAERVKDCMNQKRGLYEQLLLQEISMDGYKAQKAEVDKKLERLKQIHAALAAQTTQMQMDEKAKSARITLAQEISKASGLTAGLADTLIERVNIYPGNQVEIVWKMKDFCMEEI